jgi:hypothetical protein
MAITTVSHSSNTQALADPPPDLNDNQLDELSRLTKAILCPFAISNKCRYTSETCVYG